MQPFWHIFCLDVGYHLNYLYVEFKFRTMKTSIRLMQITLIILAVTGFSSCEKTENAVGKAEFSLSLRGNPASLNQAYWSTVE